MRQRFGLVLAGLVFSFLYVCAGDSYASAADFSSIKAKAAYEGLYTCINNGSGAVPVGEALLAKSFNASDGAGGMLLGKGDGAAVKLPFGLTDATDNNTNCKQILFGFNTNISGDELNKGLLPTDIQDTTDKSKIKNYFAGSNGQGGSGTIGYKAEGAGNVASGQTTQQLKISFDDDLADICRDSSGKLASSSFVDIDSGKTFSSLVFPTVTKDSNGNWWVGDNSSNNAGINVPEPGSGDTSYYNFCDGSLITIQDNGSALSPYYTLYGSFVQYTDDGYGNLVPSYITIDEIISASGGSYNSNKCNTRLGTILSSTCVDGVVGDSADYEDWKFTWDSSYMNLITKVNSTTNSGYKLTKTSNYSDLALTSQEVYDLYTYYIKDVFEVPVVCEGEADYDLYSDKPSINWKKGISCKADTGAPGINQYPGNVYGVNDDYHFTKEVSLDDVINTLKTIDLAEVDSTEDGGTLDDSTISGGVTTGGAVSEGDPCYNSGIEGMSWILCPAINNMASAVDGIDGMLDGWLSVDTNLYDNNSQAREAWTYFRDIANIIIIVILVVVIFSQITGFGIDNYGIKRILPRLIAMAILINLSFIICQIAIDISNILGVGLNNMFQSIGRTIYGGLTPGEVVETIVTALFAAIVGIGAASGAIITVASLAVSGGGIMLVISLVLVLLVALVAVMMFFIMLGARMVIVVIFTAIAPIAFACYVLPNTQSLFKKWWDIFKAALVVYPICGALYGMSFIIRGTVFSGGEVQFWMAIIAICAPFLPFLLLPTLLRGALSALGRVGGAVAAVGAGIRGGVRKGNQSLQNTAAYKNAQEQSRRNMTRWSAGLDRNGNRRENIGRFGRFLRGGTRGMAQARAQYRKDIETQGMEDSLMGAGFDSAVANAESNVESRRVADYQSLLDLGRARDNDGNVVNTNDAESVSRYHREALGRYRSARSADEQRQAMAQVKAAQNILSKTDKGRAGIQRNFEQAIRDGSTVGLSEAAGHLMGEYGDKYKSVNRGAHAMLSDLSTMDLSNENNIRTIQSRLDTIDNNGSIVQSGSYSMKGTDKYTEESLAGADDIALDRMIESVKNGSLTGSDLMDIQSTARRALAKSESGNLNIKPEVQRKLESIINGNNGGNSASVDNEITITHSE